MFDKNVRKSKILAFIEKDIFVLNNYETAPFKNKSHAIECLIPYHIFQLTPDDIKFTCSDVEIDLKKEIDVMKSKLIGMLDEHSFEEECFTPQLLLYHEQKYLNALAKKNLADQEESLKYSNNKDQQSVKLNKDQHSNKNSIESSTKKRKGSVNLKIKIPRTDIFKVYATKDGKIRILTKNLK
jgi:hypothetical protein